MKIGAVIWWLGAGLVRLDATSAAAVAAAAVDDRVREDHGPLGGPIGWRAVDRFRGFRFELAAPDHDAPETLLEESAALAQSLRCFGWIQLVAAHDDNADASKVVGEARCPTARATTLEAHLRGLRAEGGGRSLRLRDYANTKIRYHFTTFRVLAEPRYRGRTCFATPPHACKSSTISPPTGTTRPDASRRSDEL